MDFSEIIKTAIINVLNNMKLTEVFIAEVIDNINFKLKIDDKITLTENEIVRTKSFNYNPDVGTKILLIREQGGQKYFLLNIIEDFKYEDGGNI